MSVVPTRHACDDADAERRRRVAERLVAERRRPAGDNPWLIAVVVSIATFMEVLDTTIANVALRTSPAARGRPRRGAWVMTSYLVANAIVLPSPGWLADALGRKRFFMICVALFTV